MSYYLLGKIMLFLFPFSFRTPPPIMGDPLRIRLFPTDSDEDINDDQLYL